MISKSENRRENIQEGRDMNAVSDKWLKELVKDSPRHGLPLMSDDTIREMAEELLMLRKQEKDTNRLLCRQVGWIDKLKKQKEALIDKIIDFTDGGISIKALMEEIDNKTS